jgi:hypothetical protein
MLRAMQQDPAAVAEIDLLVRVAECSDPPPLDDDPFEGMPGGSIMAKAAARKEVELAGAIAAAVAVGLIAPERAQELRALSESYGAQERARREAAPARPDPRLGVRAVIGGPTPWRDDARVLAVECWEEEVRVRWEHRRIGPVHPERPPRTEVPVRIADDIGTEYVGGGGSSAGWTVVGGDAAFRPGIPAGARRLTVHIGQAKIELDVSGVAERPAV